MKNLPLIIVLSLFTLFAKAQKAPLSINWFTQVQHDARTTYQYIGSNNNSFFIRGQEGAVASFYEPSDEEIYLEKYNIDTYELQQSYIIEEYIYKEEKAKLITAFYSNNDIFLLYSVFIDDEKNKYILLRKVDNNGNVNGEQVVGTIKNQEKHQSKVWAQKSENSDMILIYYKTKSDKDKPFNSMVWVFDASFNKLWSKELSLDYQSNKASINNYTIANNGDVFLLCTNDDKKSELPSYTLLKVSNQSTSPEKITIPKNINPYKGFGISIDNDNKLLLVTGLYNTSENKAGAFYVSYNISSLEVVNEYYTEFKDSSLEDILSKSKNQTQEKLDNYIFKDIIKRKNDETIVIAEYQSKQIGSETAGYATSTEFMDLIILNISVDGKISLIETIPTSQSTSRTPPVYASYRVIYDENTVHILFYDNGKNYEPRVKGIKELKSTNSYSKANLIDFTIDENNDTSYTIVFNKKEVDTFIAMNSMSPLAKAALFIQSTNSRYTQLGKLSLE